MFSAQGCTEGPLWSVCWSPCGTKLAVAGCDRSIRVYRYSTSLSLESELRGAHTKTIRSLDWFKSFLTAASFDGTVSVWSARKDGKYKCAATLEGHENEVKGVRFSLDGRRLATCGRDRTVWIWAVLGDLEEDPEFVEFECEAVLQEHEQDIKCVEWHPSGNILFSAGYDNSIKVFGCPLDEDEWLCLGTLSHHTSTVWSLCWCEGALFSASADRSVVRWRNASTSGNLFNMDLVVDGRFEGLHEEAIYCMAMSGGCIVTGGADCQLVFTDRTTGEIVNRLLMPSQINCIVPHPVNASTLAIALDDGQVKII